MAWQAWLIALARKFWLTYGKKAALWLVKQIGADTVWKAIEKQLDKLNSRRLAITKAREINGKFGATLTERQLRYVVYKDDEPVEIFPPIKGDLKAAMRHYDIARLESPDDIRSARARRWAAGRWARLRTRVERGEETPQPPDGHVVEELSDLGEAEDVLGTALFEKTVARMPVLLGELTAVPPKTVGEHDGAIPDSPGVYLFSEGVTPMYVGQSRNLQQRLRQHTSVKSHENQAPFAFNIALKEAEEKQLELPRTRKATEADPAFKPLFQGALSRVAAMNVRFIEIEDPIMRTIFEIYASEALGTQRFNSFETH